MISANDGSVRRFVGGFRNGQREAVFGKTYSATKAPRLRPFDPATADKPVIVDYKCIFYIMDRVVLFPSSKRGPYSVEALVKMGDTLYHKVFDMCANELPLPNAYPKTRFANVRVFGGPAHGQKVPVIHGISRFSHEVFRDAYGRIITDPNSATARTVRRTSYDLDSVTMLNASNYHPVELFGWVPVGVSLCDELIKRLT